MNVLLITVDSLRYDSVFSENRDISLPTIDALCGSGTVCSQAFANAPYTADSFTSILSGTYPWRYGTTSEGFESDRPHVAEAFSDAGYATVGLYTNPYLGPAFDYDRGWDYYEAGSGDDGSSVMDRLRNLVVNHLDRETSLFSAIHTAHRTLGERLGIELEGKPYPSATSVRKEFRAALETLDDRPVFAWLHFMDVHSPFYPREDTVSEGLSKRKALRTFYGANKRPRDVTETEREELRRLYRGEIQYLDRELANVFDVVDEHLGREETVVLFVSDHGEAFGEHGFCFHPKELYDELVHVPFVLDAPTVDADRIETPVSNVDVVPTLLELAGERVPEACAGTPIHRLESSGDRSVFAQAVDEERTKAMVTDGDWKLIRSIRSGTEELYDRDADPGETDDRSGDQPAVLDRYQNQLDEHLGAMQLDVDDPLRSEREVADEVNERLQNLGYQR